MENNQHKDFDQFFQNKMNNRTFDYQDDFWAEMESQLPEAAKEKSRKRFLLLLLLTMVSCISVVSWFAYPSNSSSDFITKGKSNLETSNSEIKKTADENLVINNINSEIPFISKEKMTVEDIENSNDLKSIINKKGKIKTLNTIINNRNINNKKPFQLDGNDIIINTKGSENKTSDEGKSDIENTISGTQPMAGNSESENENRNESVAINSKEIGSYATENEFLLNSLLTKRFLLEDNSEENRADKLNLIKPNCDGCPILPPAHQIKIGLIAGLNTSLGYQNIGDSRANPSLDPSIGFRVTYRHSMTSQWRTNIEAIYFSRSALNSQIGYDSISYGFGSTVISRSIDIEELHYISLPIYATYQYNKKHAFMGGLSFGYLLNAQSQTNGNVTETTGNDANIYAEPATQEWGYTTAFNRFDIGATLGYDYEVQKGWKVGARLNYGLRDVTKNSIFNNNTFDNNISLRLVMTCDLFIL